MKGLPGRFRSSLFFLTLLMFYVNSKGVQAQQKMEAKLSAVELAKKHKITFNGPAVDFFEGALLGNGGMGVVVTTRPDGIALYFGHNNVWDIRIAENHREEIGTFQKIFDKVNQIPTTLNNLTDDPWYRQYNSLTGDNYSKPYPRPFPCGSLWLGFDRRENEVIGHELDIAKGRCVVKLLNQNKNIVFLELFTEMNSDKLWMRLMDSLGNVQPNIFNRIKLIPDPSTPREFPKYDVLEKTEQGLLAFKQLLPIAESGSINNSSNTKDKAFSLAVQLNGKLIKQSRINWSGNKQEMAQLEAGFENSPLFFATVELTEGLKLNVPELDKIKTVKPEKQGYDKAALMATTAWKNYWEKSAVTLSDDLLEQTWYRNLYFLNCAAKAGVTCPGLFANWSYNNIGTAWHGDYHLNYNVQQPFWATFSSNHLEKNLPYVNLIKFLMPVSRRWAKEYYQLPGAYFPHSAYPVEMTMNPYPIPDWGWEISETPWAVQGLWWHYLYSGDTAFLRQHVYEPMKAAVEFLVAYMFRPEAKGGQRWKDDKFHIFPTVPPELYGLRPGFEYNYDCIIDLALTKCIFKAFQQATTLLTTAPQEKLLLDNIQTILSRFPDYPTTTLPNGQKIWVSVPGENSEIVYNVPLPLSPVFPGEEHGLDADKQTLQLIKNTFLQQQNEGGNDLVFSNLQAARAGLLDLEKFKRQVSYCLLPNGTATDKVLQTGGRYNELTDYTYMSRMGIWFENFALPAVINECLMQSYNGTIRLFPNWPANKDAAFRDLRAAGAFLISAEQKAGKVKQITVTSEKGNTLRIYIPWGKSGFIIRGNRKEKITQDVLHLTTKPGEKILLVK